MSSLKFTLLGGFELIDDQTRVPPLAKKVRGLLAYLVLTRPRPQPREKLAELLWPDSSEAQARMSLRSALATLRQALGGDPRGRIVSDTESVSLLYEQISADVWELELLASQDDLDALGRAFKLYAGELLAAVRFEAFAFEQWLETERTRFLTMAVDVGARLLSALHSSKRLDEALSVGNRLLALDPLREDVQRTLMRVHAEQGHPARAIKQYQLCRSMLAKELGVSPELETERVYQTLLERRRTESPADSQTHPASNQANGAVGSLIESSPTPRSAALLAIRFRSDSATDLEDIHRLVMACRSRIQTLLERNNGVQVAQDDGLIMVAFGLERAHSNDAERALRTALALRESLSGQNVGFAVATGWLLVSGSGDHTSVTGAPCGIVKALAERTTTGQILLCDETYHTLAPLLDAEALTQRTSPQGWVVKVFSGALQNRQSPPFVGRREVLRQLLGVLEIATSVRAAHAVLIRGEAGIGKTRLAAKVAELAKKREVDCYFVRIFDFGGEANRDPLAQLGHGLLGLAEHATVDQRTAAAEHAVKLGLLSAAQRVFAYMLLDLPQPEDAKYALESLDLSARSQGKLALLATLIEHRSRHRALMIVIEDIHWTSRDALDQIASLAFSVQSLPLVLLLTSRPENDPIDASWRRTIRGVHFTAIDLPPLSANEARQMAAYYGNKESSVVEVCIKRAEGNPLFLDQLLRAASGVDVPNSIQSVVLAQVDLLPRPLREALQAASVIGQQFPPALIDHMLGEARVSLEELRQCALITRDAGELRFVHALVQEAVYASILRSKKSQLHARAAEWFATRDLERQAEHLDAAGSAEAVSAYLAAADHLNNRGNPRAALRLAERAAARIGSDDSLRERLTLLRAQLLLELGHTEDALKEFRSALNQIASDIGKRRALKGIAAALRILDRHQEALITLDEAQTYAVPSDDAEAAEECLLRGNLHFPLGETAQCIAAHQQARALANKAKSPRLEASALGCLGDAYYLAGRFLSAHQHAEACVELARRHGLNQVHAANQAMLAVTHMYRLEFPLALSALTEAIGIAKRFNLTRHEALGYVTLADVKMAMGEFEQARQNAEIGLQLARRVGARRFESDGLHQLGLALYCLGEKRRPKQLIEEALDITRAVGEAYNGAWVLGVAAMITKSSSARQEYLRRGEVLLREPCVGHNHMYFYRYAIEAALHMQDWKLALRYTDALELYTRPQPMPWSDFHIKQGRILARLGSDAVDARLTQELNDLHLQAEQLGIATIARQIE